MHIIIRIATPRVRRLSRVSGGAAPCPGRLSSIVSVCALTIGLRTLVRLGTACVLGRVFLRYERGRGDAGGAGDNVWHGVRLAFVLCDLLFDAER